MIFQSLTFIGLFDDYEANKVHTMSTSIDWYWSLVLNGVTIISIGARSLGIRLLQQSVTLFLIRRKYVILYSQNDPVLYHIFVSVHEYS